MIEKVGMQLSTWYPTQPWKKKMTHAAFRHAVGSTNEMRAWRNLSLEIDWHQYCAKYTLIPMD
jgi:hypothetical protein